MLCPRVGQRPLGWAVDMEAAKHEGYAARPHAHALNRSCAALNSVLRLRPNPRAGEGSTSARSSTARATLVAAAAGLPYTDSKGRCQQHLGAEEAVMQVVILLCCNSYGAGSEAAARPRRRKRECPPAVYFRVSGAGRSSTLKVDLQHKPPARQLAEARRRLQRSHLQAQPAACWPSICARFRQLAAARGFLCRCARVQAAADGVGVVQAAVQPSTCAGLHLLPSAGRNGWRWP